MVGGQELAIDALASEMQKLGHLPAVLTLPGVADAAQSDAELAYPVFRHRRYFSTRHFLSFYERFLDRCHQRFPFEVLHCHNVYPAGFIAVRWAVKRRVPLVITSHACDIAEESHLLRKPGVPDRVREVLQNAAAIVAISPSVANRFLALGATPDQILHLPNGVHIADLATPIPRSVISSELPAGRYFLFLGRLVHRKGADLLLQALHSICAQTDASVVIAGQGEELERLQQMVQGLELAKRVFFPGIVSGKLKSYLLQNALATVVPSRISEGSSLVVLESAAAGRPVIAAAVPGLCETVQPQRNGLLCKEDSVSELAQAMLGLADNPARADELGANAQHWVAQYDWRQITVRHLELYEEVVAKPTRLLSAA